MTRYARHLATTVVLALAGDRELAAFAGGLTLGVLLGWVS